MNNFKLDFCIYNTIVIVNHQNGIVRLEENDFHTRLYPIVRCHYYIYVNCIVSDVLFSPTEKTFQNEHPVFNL